MPWRERTTTQVCPGVILESHDCSTITAVTACRQPCTCPTNFGLHLPGRLRNPHTSIKYKPLDGGQIELVKGDYDYYHYMQDKMDDNVRDWRFYLRGGERCSCSRFLTCFRG